MRDREDAGLYKLRSRLLEMRFQRTGSQADLLAAIGAGRQAVSMYPTSPDEHLWLAGMLGRSAARLSSPELATEAIKRYEQALALDKARPGTDEPRKHTAGWREDIEKRIERLREITASQPSSAGSL